MVRGRECGVVEGQLEITASEGVPMGKLKRETGSKLRKRPIGRTEGVHSTPFVSREEDIGDILKKELGEARLGGESRSRMNKPAGTISGVIIARGEVIVIQDRYTGREVEVRAKDRGERVTKVEDTKILTNVDVTARDVIGKEGSI